MCSRIVATVLGLPEIFTTGSIGFPITLPCPVGKRWITAPDAEALNLPELLAERPPASAGLALSLGGDGTMLRTVKLLDGAAVPIIGVNVGLLGYLSEIEPPVPPMTKTPLKRRSGWRR